MTTITIDYNTVDDSLQDLKLSDINGQSIITYCENRVLGIEIYVLEYSTKKLVNDTIEWRCAIDSWVNNSNMWDFSDSAYVNLPLEKVSPETAIDVIYSRCRILKAIMYDVKVDISYYEPISNQQ